MRRLKQAGFIISPKSELRLSKRLVFMGKLPDTLRKTVTNQLASTLRMWIRGVGAGTMSAVDRTHMLGRIQWVLSPATLSCFLAGTYCTLHNGTGGSTLGLIRSIGTALLFTLAPQSFRQQLAAASAVYLVKAAPPIAGNPHLTLGIVGPKGCYRFRWCPT